PGDDDATLLRIDSPLKKRDGRAGQRHRRPARWPRPGARRRRAAPHERGAACRDPREDAEGTRAEKRAAHIIATVSVTIEEPQVSATFGAQGEFAKEDDGPILGAGGWPLASSLLLIGGIIVAVAMWKRHDPELQKIAIGIVAVCA